MVGPAHCYKETSAQTYDNDKYIVINESLLSDFHYQLFSPGGLLDAHGVIQISNNGGRACILSKCSLTIKSKTLVQLHWRKLCVYNEWVCWFEHYSTCHEAMSDVVIAVLLKLNVLVPLICSWISTNIHNNDLAVSKLLHALISTNSFLISWLFTTAKKQQKPCSLTFSQYVHLVDIGSNKQVFAFKVSETIFGYSYSRYLRYYLHAIYRVTYANPWTYDTQK